MATESKANEVNNEVANKANNELVEITSKVVKVMTPQQTNDGKLRLIFMFDDSTTFKSIKYGTGEVVETNKFSLNAIAATNQLVKFVPEIQLAETLALGNPVNPRIIALAMTNAVVTIKREFKSKDDVRENTQDTYGTDLWKTTFTNVKTNINPIFSNMINHLLMSEPAIVTTQAAAMPNPYNIQL